VLMVPHSTTQLRAELAARFPQYDAAALAFACRNLLPLIQVPPRGLWSRSGQVVGTTPLAWLGRDLDSAPSVDDVMLRYVAAFGPATVQDAATWSRYTGLHEVFDRLGGKLRTYHNEDGREYFDVPDAPLPDPATPAPVRFLPQYDNLLLSHKDRRRFIAKESEAMSSIWMGRTGFVGTVLIDGTGAGMWRIDVPKRRAAEPAKPATLTVTTIRRLATDDAADVEREGTRFLQFACPDVDHVVRLQAIS
jgi:winged helix DNA-binding protein